MTIGHLNIQDYPENSIQGELDTDKHRKGFRRVATQQTTVEQAEEMKGFYYSCIGREPDLLADPTGIYLSEEDFWDYNNAVNP